MANLPDAQKLLRNFSRCLNWEEKYVYIIELGAALEPFSPEWRQPENLVAGCQSQVWIVLKKDQEGLVHLHGDSDAAIVKGLIALLFTLYQDQPAEKILTLDVRPFFAELALSQHLTPSRTQGLDAMLRTIHGKVAALV